MNELKCVEFFIKFLQNIQYKSDMFETPRAISMLEGVKNHLETHANGEEQEQAEDIAIIIPGGRCNLVREKQTKNYCLQRTDGTQSGSYTSLYIGDVLLTWLEMELDLDFGDIPIPEA